MQFFIVYINTDNTETVSVYWTCQNRMTVSRYSCVVFFQRLFISLTMHTTVIYTDNNVQCLWYKYFMSVRMYLNINRFNFAHKLSVIERATYDNNFLEFRCKLYLWETLWYINNATEEITMASWLYRYGFDWSLHSFLKFW